MRRPPATRAVTRRAERRAVFPAMRIAEQRRARARERDREQGRAPDPEPVFEEAAVESIRSSPASLVSGDPPARQASTAAVTPRRPLAPALVTGPSPRARARSGRAPSSAPGSPGRGAGERLRPTRSALLLGARSKEVTALLSSPLSGPLAGRSAGGQSPGRFLHWSVITRPFAAPPRPRLVHVPPCTNRGIRGGRTRECAWNPRGFAAGVSSVFHTARRARAGVLDPCGRLASLPPSIHSPIAIANTPSVDTRRVHTATCTGPTPTDPQLGRPLIKETDPFLLEKRDVIHNRADDRSRPLRTPARTADGRPRRHDS